MKVLPESPRLRHMIFLLFLCVPLVWRSRYGFDWSDETYYTTLIYRLASGDKLFSQMWELHQLSVIPLFIPAKLYLTFSNGSTEGMILFFRILYCLSSCTASVCVYSLLSRRYSATASFFVSATAQVFVHFAIPNFSYDSMTPLLFLLSWCLWSCADRNRTGFFPPFAAGVLYALAVQCYPQSAVTILPVAFMLLSADRDAGRRKKAMYFLCGCLSVVILFLCFIAYSSSLSAIPENLADILQDPTHGVKNIPHLFLNWGHTILIILGPAAWADIALFIVITALRILMHAWSGERGAKARGVLFCLLAAAGIVSVLSVALYRTDLVSKNNFLAISLFLLAPSAFLLSRDLRSDTIWLYFIGTGFSLSAHIFSNMGIYASSFPLILTAFSEILCMDELRSDLFGNAIKPKEKNAGDQATISKHRMGAYALHASAAFLLCFLCITRLFAVHRDASLMALRSVITIGPAKGIITTEKSAAEYSEITDAVLRYAPESGSILITSHAPFCYLITGLHPASYSVWNSPYSERLQRWYDKNPDRLPDMIVSIEKGIGFSKGNGNLETALDDMKEKGRDYSIVYSSSVCRVLLTDQQDPF